MRAGFAVSAGVVALLLVSCAAPRQYAGCGVDDGSRARATLRRSSESSSAGAPALIVHVRSVRDTLSGPLAGAQVRLLPARVNVNTSAIATLVADESGIAVLSPDSAGDYTVQVRAIGFRALLRRVALRSGTRDTLLVELPIDVLCLQS